MPFKQWRSTKVFVKMLDKQQETNYRSHLKCICYP